MSTNPLAEFDLTGRIAVVTGAVLYLASKASDLVIGHILLVNVGRTAK